jgi:single-strand DNA-binding protein
MNSINHCTLLGHMTSDPRFKTLPSGKSLCEFGLALNRRWLDINGDSHQETTFVDVTAWSQLAEVITHYCQKGRPIVVEGRLEQERWETPAGEKRSRLKIVAQRITLLPANSKAAREAEPLPDWATEVLSDDQGH